ncbi:MAG: paraquat-inducible protein A [Lentisphaeraceae bacterium]|nr:paraquat-inducible protein A [Lentisphaeraceae bacterium]
MDKTACIDCGTIIEIQDFDRTHQYNCPRCKSTFYRPGESLLLILVMAFTSLLFFIPATFLPIMTIEIMNQEHSATLIEAMLYLSVDGHTLIAAIAAGVGVFIPLGLLVIILLIVVPLQFGRSAESLRFLFRLYKHLTTWSMAEVYLIGIVVAIIKLQGMAGLHIDFGLISFVFFLLSFYVTTTWFNPIDLWNQHELEN